MAISKKPLLIAALLLTSTLLLGGCWDRTETNDVAFVIASSVDLEDNGLYRIAFMLPLPGQMGGANGGGGGTSGGNSFYIDSELGTTIREAIYKLQKRMARKIFLSHRRTIVIGENLAKKGIHVLFDVIPRIPEGRLNSFLIVTKGKGYDLLQARPKFERFPAEAARELVKAPQTMPLTIKDIGLALSSNSDPIIAYMEVMESKAEKPSKEIALIGYAQFREDKMIGIYREQHANGLMMLRNQIKEHAVTFPMESGQNISIHITEGKTKITPYLKQGKVDFKINLEIKGKVREDRSELDLNESKLTHKVEKKLAEHMKKEIQATVKQMQTAGTDSAQLGLLVWRKYPYDWKHGIEDNWRELFKKAEFTYKVDTSITETGLINQNILKEGESH